MFRRRSQESAAADRSFAQAMEQLDLFVSKLDNLKQTYNQAARALDRSPPTMPTPIQPFYPPGVERMNGVPKAVPQANGKKPSGRYSMIEQSAPQAASIPKPEPQSGPKRTHSGRYYLQLEGAKDPTELRKIREEVAKCGRVVDSGSGTASDPEAGWMEVAVRADDTGSFIVKLEELEVKSRVMKMIAVDPGEGRVQAKQLDLFRAKQDSSSDS